MELLNEGKNEGKPSEFVQKLSLLIQEKKYGHFLINRKFFTAKRLDTDKKTNNKENKERHTVIVTVTVQLT